MTQTRDTIAAIATPPGVGGVGVLRVSGSKALDIAQALIGKATRPRSFHFSTFRDGDGTALDNGLAVTFAAPRSFTGENVLELHAHGSPVVLNLLLRRVCALGARPARPGEFSERAFLNGKIDLVQAEAVADLIAAGSEVAARAALRSLDGEFSAQVHNLLDALVHLRAWLEAALDFPEEEIDFLSAPELDTGLSTLRTQLAELLAATRRGVVLREGLHVVIVGRPNAGKSSLLNALAQSERAIVTEVPGTTRDVLRESIALEGVEITLVDTAGLRDTQDPIEQEGMRRARAELGRADVAILVTDTASLEVDRNLLAECADTATRLFVHNKIDLGDETAQVKRDGESETHIFLSAKRGDGLPELRAELARLAGRGDGTQGAFSARTRHVDALERVAVHLQAAERSLREQRAGELAADELLQAQRALGEITGEFSSDDLLGAIFSTFCIGK
jgi:tRNA modification GTPase